MYEITTPVEGFTGTVAGVDFAGGRALTAAPAALAYFARRGYTVTPVEAPPPEPDPSPDPPGDDQNSDGPPDTPAGRSRSRKG
ncbi:hypothetical protein ACFV5N_02075 [Streptomyces sp. NPDC059853]|uniref:hypothetical protein n=1 Tax=Streptomyces sp. NPDC059853 TaxID=3346973 RepID=UPI003669D256